MIVFRVDQRCTDILQDSVAVFIESPSLLQHKKFSKLSRVFHLTFVAIKLHEKYNRYRKTQAKEVCTTPGADPGMGGTGASEKIQWLDTGGSTDTKINR